MLEGIIDFDVLVLARWLNFAAVFALFGCSFFPMIAAALRPGVSWSEIAGSTVPLLRVAAPLAAASTVLWCFATAATMAGGFSGVVDPGFLRIFFFQTPFGTAELVGSALATALLAAALLPAPAQLRCAAVAAVSAALLVSQAWLGHAAEGGNTAYGWAMIASYAVHVLAGAAWLGSLPVLLVGLTRSPEASEIMRRFSTMASVAVGAIVISGVANILFRVGRNIGALVASAYGTILAVKLGLVAAMLGLAAYNRFVAMPQLNHMERISGRLRLSIAAELALGLLVLGVVAVLGITAPPL